MVGGGEAKGSLIERAETRQSIALQRVLKCILKQEMISKAFCLKMLPLPVALERRQVFSDRRQWEGGI